ERPPAPEIPVPHKITKSALVVIGQTRPKSLIRMLGAKKPGYISPLNHNADPETNPPRSKAPNGAQKKGPLPKDELLHLFITVKAMLIAGLIPLPMWFQWVYFM